MEVRSTKKVLTLSILVIVVTAVLVGCQQKETIGSSLQTFVNNKYGYSIELPKTWGAIQPYGEAFTSNLYDELETIGPDLPTAFNNDRDQYYLDVEVFSSENTKREPNQTWIDFYTKFRLEGTTYLIQKWDETTTEIALLGKSGQTCGQVKTGESESELSFESKCFDNKNDAEFYKRTCRLIEHGAKLYSFCYNNENNIHSGIMKSIKFE